MSDARELLSRTAEIAADYLESLGDRPVFPRTSPEELREALGGPMPESPLDAEVVLNELVEGAEPGVVAMGSGRYFGFVIGGALPAALAADWLASAWDQNAGLYVCGPSASVVEQVTREWLVELLGLPGEASVGFVTGTQMAHVTGLAAARFHVLDGRRLGREPRRAGRRAAGAGARRRQAPRHRRPRATAARARRADHRSAQTTRAGWRPALCSRGARRRAGDRLRPGRRGEHRRLRPARRRSRPPVQESGAWLHVDGAFGIWAAVSPRAAPSRRRHRAAPTPGRPTRTSG